MSADQVEPTLEVSLAHPARGVVVCSVSGEVDIATVEALRVAVFGALSSHPEYLVLDLSLVELFSAAGTHLLDDLVDAARPRTQLVLVSNAVVETVLIALTPDPERPRRFESVAAAVQSLRGGV